MAPTIVFAGDSITDSGRRQPDSGPLGSGYVRLLAPVWQERGWTVVNAGIAGDRVRDLVARWHSDVERHEPAVISLLVGINDVWRRFDAGDPTSAADFARDYRTLLERPAGQDVRWVLGEPFLLPVTADQLAWADDLDAKREVVRAIAREFGAVLVPLHELFAEDAAEFGAAALTTDGVHLTARGYERLALHWSDLVEP